MTLTLQQSAEVVNRSTMLCRSISPISATVLRLWQMWPLGENVSWLTPKWQLVRKRNPQANLLRQQHFKQMPRSISLLQKVKSWILVILLYLNTDHTFVLWIRCPWTPIWRRRFSEYTSSPITHHSGMIRLTQQVFKFPMILNLVSFPFDFIWYSIHLRLPGNPGQVLPWYRYDLKACS